MSGARSSYASASPAMPSCPVSLTLPPVLIGMEACGGAPYWARRFREHHHAVKLMAPQFFKPSTKSNKNDMRDAEGIGEAVTRPTIDHRAHLRRNIRFCITSYQTIGCTA